MTNVFKKRQNMLFFNSNRQMIIKVYDSIANGANYSQNYFPSKMTETFSQLSSNAINALTKKCQESESILVQVIEFQPKKDKYYLILSDGCFTIKALPKDQHILNPETDINAIIEIKEHMTGKNNVVGILEFEKLFNYKAKIGNPQQFNADSINPENIEAFKLEKSMIDLKISSNQKTIPKQQPKANVQEQATVKKQHIPQTQKKFPNERKFVIPTEAKPLGGNLKDFEIIKNLYIGMNRWTIVCRIVNLEYKQFISQKNGKQTKLLSVELMDRTGMKISGTFFGQAAQSFRDYLIKDRVYKVSQGSIREQNYNNTKNEKMSPYKLMFSTNTLFEEVSDTSSIAKNEDSAITLGECVERRIVAQQFDVVAILVDIGETVEVKKDEKLLKKTNLLIADPIKNITIQAVIWNENMIPDRSLISKTLILTRFKLSEYKGSLNLGSTYKSTIVPSEVHDYRRYESQVMNNYTSYEKLYEIKSTGIQQYDIANTIRELEQRIENLGYDEWAKADLIICINKFALKKWHFDGCPHCGKAAEQQNNCTHCHKFVQKTVGHFILGLQISDSTGSLWTTAYDEWAKKIFGVSDQTQVIDYLLRLDANQLKQETQTFLYQEFKLRISSKKDNEGRIKHHASKIHDRNYAEETMKNIQLINSLRL